MSSPSTHPFTTLVNSQDLAANLENPEWRILDCRFSLVDVTAGRKAYDESHIPGAGYISLDDDLSTPHIPGETGRHPLPEKDSWIKTVQNLGIHPEIQVVVYDDAGGAIASRLWWMLRWIGHEKVALLNGGWQAWESSGNAVNSGDEPDPTRSDFDYVSCAPLARMVETAVVNGAQQMLLDARELPRFTGETEPLDPIAGHIPGAICSPFSANLDADGLLLPAVQLKKKFRDAAMTDREVVCYCGSGVTACHNILAMKIAGLAEPALYAGSWSEWITDPQRPVATGGDS